MWPGVITAATTVSVLGFGCVALIQIRVFCSERSDVVDFSDFHLYSTVSFDRLPHCCLNVDFFAISSCSDAKIVCDVVSTARGSDCSIVFSQVSFLAAL